MLGKNGGEVRGGRQKTQHSLSEQEVLSQIYIFQTIDVCERKQAINFHSQRTFKANTSVITISPVVHCTPIFTSPNLWMILSKFSAVLQSSAFLCTQSAGAAKTLARGKLIITCENSYTVLFILLQGLEQSINSHENEVIAVQASDS